MNHDFSSYEAYLERYKMFYDEEGDNRPPILEHEQFMRLFQLLKESYGTYKEMIELGHRKQAANYYSSVISDLENKLAIADASDNFHVDIIHS